MIEHWCKGFAYPRITGDVYIAFRRFADYGQLNNRHWMTALRCPVRRLCATREDPLDFVPVESPQAR